MHWTGSAPITRQPLIWLYLWPDIGSPIWTFISTPCEGEDPCRVKFKSTAFALLVQLNVNVQTELLSVFTCFHRCTFRGSRWTWAWHVLVNKALCAACAFTPQHADSVCFEFPVSRCVMDRWFSPGRSFHACLMTSAARWSVFILI